MKLNQYRGLLLLTVTAMLWGACSDENTDPKECPSCDPGYSCNTATGACEKDGEVPECDSDGKNTCKSEVYYCASATNKCVRCDEDAYNCDGDNKTMCEEDKACSIGNTCDPEERNSCGQNDEVFCDTDECNGCESGKYNCDGLGDCTDDKKCGALSNCDAENAFDCPSETFQRYCDEATSKCKTCSSGKYSCDGLGDCTDDTCETTTKQCEPSTDNSCDTALRYCDVDTCVPCTGDMFNCNGENGDKCENSGDCLDANGCVVECVAFLEEQCSRRAVGGCQDCNATEDCTNNPRSNGPICDTSDLAGTGFNFCICVSDADCSDSTRGSVCKTGKGVPNPKLKQCSCDTADDCPSSHPICEGEYFQRCVKKCIDSTDCSKAGGSGWCDTATGECEYNER